MRPIGSTNNITFVKAHIDGNTEGRDYAGSVWVGFTSDGDVCRCEALPVVEDLRQADWLAPDKRGWYCIRANKMRGRGNSGIDYSYSGPYDLRGRESPSYGKLDIDNTEDPSYVMDGYVDFVVYWEAIGPLAGNHSPTDTYFNDPTKWVDIRAWADTPGGTVSGGGVYLVGDNVTIAATSYAGYKVHHLSYVSSTQEYDWPIIDRADFSTTIIAREDAAIIVDFAPCAYIVTFDKQGGSGGTSSVTATYEAAMPSITVPIRTGYVFDGYYTETNGGGRRYYRADGTSANDWFETSDTTLYAKWRENEGTGLLLHGGGGALLYGASGTLLYDGDY